MPNLAIFPTYGHFQELKVSQQGRQPSIGTESTQGRIFIFFRGGKIMIFTKISVIMAREARQNFYLPPPGKFLPPPLIYHFREGQIFSRVGQKFLSQSHGGRKYFPFLCLKKPLFLVNRSIF